MRIVDCRPFHGSGVTDSGETDWTVSNEPGLRVRITRPAGHSNLP